MTHVVVTYHIMFNPRFVKNMYDITKTTSQQMRKFTNIFRAKRKNNISLILSALCLLMAASCL